MGNSSNGLLKFTIVGRLDGLNDYTKACRGNAYAGNKMKSRNEVAVRNAIRVARLRKVDHYPVTLRINWYEPNKRRDIDNITFATKFIQDALVFANVLVDDSQKYICKIEHNVYVDKNNPRIEVTLDEFA